MDPLVSVLMVAYNASHFLGAAVDSILHQTFEHLELVLVDNGSTDGSVDALRRNCRDPRMRIIPLGQNLRHNGGLRAGLPHCRGELVAIMDADDISLPLRLIRQVEFLQKNPGINGVGCFAATIDHEGQITGHEFTLCDDREIRCFARYEMPFPFPTLMARHEILEEFPFRAEFPVAHDLDWLARAAERSRFEALPELLFHYRRHPGATTSQSRVQLYTTASVVRLAQARRHAGRTEDLVELLSKKDIVMREQPTESDVFIFFGRLALMDGLLLQAAWHARKAAISGKKWAGMQLLLATLARAQKLAPPESTELYRLGLLGTVRAYRLHPQSPRA